jgi:ketosteroid isomerase-like protein
VSDSIRPPVARQPAEALELVSQALSDGDLEAALAQYEATARLLTWRTRAASADADVRGALTCFMELRLPLTVRIGTVLSAAGVALVICERRIAGTGPDGQPVSYRGHGGAVLRARPDGTWRIAADAWSLGADVPEPGPEAAEPGPEAAEPAEGTEPGPEVPL